MSLNYSIVSSSTIYQNVLSARLWDVMTNKADVIPAPM